MTIAQILLLFLINAITFVVAFTMGAACWALHQRMQDEIMLDEEADRIQIERAERRLLGTIGNVHQMTRDDEGTPNG